MSRASYGPNAGVEDFVGRVNELAPDDVRRVLETAEEAAVDEVRTRSEPVVRPQLSMGKRRRMRRSLVSLVALVLIAPSTPADAQTVSWTHQFGTARSDRAWDVVGVGTDVYVVGETDGHLGGPTFGGYDGFLRRYSAGGALVWTAHIGAEGTDLAFSVAADATGVYVVGQTDTDPSDEDPRDGFLAKYDTDGAQLWFQTIATRRDDLALGVVADGAGVYVVGSTIGRLSGQERIGTWDAFLVRFDQDGNQEWATQFGTPGIDFAYSNAVTPFGIAISGRTSGELEGGRRDGGEDAFAALFDTDGNQIWIRGYGTRATDFGFGVTSDASGIYVSGQTYGHFVGQEHVGDGFYSDSYVRKLSPDDGTRVWVRQFGTPRSDDSAAVAVHGDEVVVGGTVAGTFPGQTRAGKGDAYVRSFLAETGADGWAFQFGSPGQDGVLSIAVDGDVCYVVGDTHDAFAGETSSGGTDAFVTSIALETTGA